MRSDSRRNRDRVLDAALEVLTVDPDAAIEDVAAAAGVTRSTVYRRFAGRDQLLAAVQVRLIEETRALFLEAVAGEPDHRRCMAVLLPDAVRQVHQRRWLWQRLTEMHALDDYRPQGAFVDWLAAGQRAGAFRDDVPVAWLMTVWMQLVFGGSVVVERNGILIDEAAAMALDAAERAFAPRP
ncbi:MAG: TetR/AcrR family transcriptional regulator [Thermoleophilia bacterium]